MHWVIQDGFERERGFDELIAVLGKLNLPFSIHKVVPLSEGRQAEFKDDDGNWVKVAPGGIFPDPNPSGPTIVIGSYSMRHVAKLKGWQPGCFDLDEFDYFAQQGHWGLHLLNPDAMAAKFADVPALFSDPRFVEEIDDEFFIRPLGDNKYFAGQVYDRKNFLDWHHKVVALHEDTGSSLRGDTLVLVSAPKPIQREYRTWIIDGKVATASLYKIGGRVRYDAHVEDEVLAYAQQRAQEYSPVRAFVLDVALTDDGYKIVEVNTLNAAGFYAANIGKLVDALESMSY